MAKKELEEAVTVDEATPEMEHIPEPYQEETGEDSEIKTLLVVLLIAVIVAVAVLTLYFSGVLTGTTTPPPTTTTPPPSTVTTPDPREVELERIKESSKELAGIVNGVYRPENITDTAILYITAPVTTLDTIDLFATTSAASSTEEIFGLTLHRAQATVEGIDFDDITGGETVHITLYENIYDAPDFATIRSLKLISVPNTQQ